ncbi:hypothetical protein [Chryseobacterium mulctrae]|uniref:hypothetical protein n=1 Tax=Chryseobacterium mulctrae TaxID=2576777 RepID=UPI001115C0A2|nr:hypothetical protein [Chryseobacterium mulctrae]
MIIIKSKILLTLTILYFGIAFSQTKADSLEIENINKYSETINENSKIAEYQFEVKSKNKIVKYQYSKKGNEIVEITREWKVDNGDYIDTYIDYFLLKNEERVYVNQSIVFKKKSDEEIIGGWSCTFWIKKDKVIHMTSLGHGKTELPDWDYEKELKENFNYMMKQVQKVEKNKNK